MSISPRLVGQQSAYFLFTEFRTDRVAVALRAIVRQTGHQPASALLSRPGPPTASGQTQPNLSHTTKPSRPLRHLLLGVVLAVAESVGLDQPLCAAELPELSLPPA